MDYGAYPVARPPDFHAYVEVYLTEGTSSPWYLSEALGTAIPMAFVRFLHRLSCRRHRVCHRFCSRQHDEPVISI